MSIKRMIQAVECHAGEPMRVITGGVPIPPGDSVYEQMKWMEKYDDQLRKLMLREPRGYPAVCCNMVVPAKDPRAAMGYIIMEQTEYCLMSGGNTIAVATVLLETGMIKMVEPVTEFYLEAPAGLIHIKAECIIFHSRLRNCTKPLVKRYVSLSMPAARVKWCSHGEQQKA